MNFIIVFRKALSAIRFWYRKYDIPFLKNRCNLDLTLTMPFKVKLTFLVYFLLSYVPLRTIQLLFKTFFYYSFREILMHYLK